MGNIATGLYISYIMILQCHDNTVCACMCVCVCVRVDVYKCISVSFLGKVYCETCYQGM